MGTQYSVIRGYARTLLGDFDSAHYRYTDQILNQQINVVILLINDPATFGYVAVDSDYEFVNDLTLASQARLALRVAINLLMALPTKFSYKTPIISVSRDNGGTSALIASYTDMLAEVEGTSLVFASDNELTAFFQGPTRLLRDINDAISAT